MVRLSSRADCQSGCLGGCPRACLSERSRSTKGSARTACNSASFRCSSFTASNSSLSCSRASEIRITALATSSSGIGWGGGTDSTSEVLRLSRPCHKCLAGTLLFGRRDRFGPLTAHRSLRRPPIGETRHVGRFLHGLTEFLHQAQGSRGASGVCGFLPCHQSPGRELCLDSQCRNSTKPSLWTVSTRRAVIVPADHLAFYEIGAGLLRRLCPLAPRGPTCRRGCGVSLVRGRRRATPSAPAAAL
jgi:hypothetical protein